MVLISDRVRCVITGRPAPAEGATARPRALKRRARRLSLDALEQRISPDTALYAGGLEFLAIGQNNWTGPAISSEVQIGLKPASGHTFAPQPDVNGGLSLNTAGNTAAMTATGSAMRVYSGTSQSTATAVFSGTHAFAVGTTMLTQTDTGASAVSVAGQAVNLTRLDLSGGTTVAGLGSIPVDGFAIPVPASLPLTLSASGVTVLTLTLSSGTGLSIGGEHFKLFHTTPGGSAVSASVTYDTANNAIDVDGSASLSWGSSSTGAESSNDVGLTLGNGTLHGLVFQNGSLTSLDAAITTDFDYRGLVFHLSGLALTYDKTDAEFTLSGGASLTWTGRSNGNGSDATAKDTLAITLGNVATGVPGLVIKGGSLLYLNTSVTGSITIKDVVTVSAK